MIIQKLNCDNPPNLAHTDVVHVLVDGKASHNSSWINILRLAAYAADSRGSTVGRLRELTGRDVIETSKQQLDFTVVRCEGHEVFIRRQSAKASHVWASAYNILRAYQIPFDITVRWAKEGTTGRLLSESLSPADHGCTWRQ